MTLDLNMLATLQKNLEDEKIRLEEELSRFAQPTGEPGEYETRYENIGTDRDENASEVEAYSDNVALENALEHQYKEAAEALAKIAAGIYGTCEHCGKDIPVERLQAYPAAKTCIQHAE